MRRPVHLPAPTEPFSTINTTPIIDIMLVLLIMMILNLPAPTHKVPLDLPTADGTAGVPPPVRLLGIDARGTLSWDSRPITNAELRPRLVAMVADPAKPVLHLRTDLETPYERFDQTMAAVMGVGVTRIGFVGNPSEF